MEPQRCDRLDCPSPPNLVGTGSRPSLNEMRRPAESARPGGQGSETLGLMEPEIAAGLMREEMSVPAPGNKRPDPRAASLPLIQGWDPGPGRGGGSDGETRLRGSSGLRRSSARGCWAPSTRPHLGNGAFWRQ